MVSGSLIGQLVAHDDDEAGTLNSQLTYTIESQDPPNTSNMLSIDTSSGRIQTLRLLQRKDQHVYKFNVRVNDLGNTHKCVLLT